MDITCPFCGKSHYTYHYSETTALGWVPEFVDGKCVTKNPNVVTSHYTCCECGHDFEVKEQFGEIQSITDKGKPAEVPLVVGPSLNEIAESDTVDPNWYIFKDTKTDSNWVELPIKSDIQQLHEDMQDILTELRCIYAALASNMQS